LFNTDRTYMLDCCHYRAKTVPSWKNRHCGRKITDRRRFFDSHQSSPKGSFVVWTETPCYGEITCADRTKTFFSWRTIRRPSVINE